MFGTPGARVDQVVYEIYRLKSVLYWWCLRSFMSYVVGERLFSESRARCRVLFLRMLLHYIAMHAYSYTILY